MTIRSKQWYTNASRLPNSVRKESIGPLPPMRSPRQRDYWTGDRWTSSPRGCRERLPRPSGLAQSASADTGSLSPHRDVSSRGALWLDDATAAIVVLDRRESGRRLWPQWGCRARALLLDCDGISQRAGVPPASREGSKTAHRRRPHCAHRPDHGGEADAHRTAAKADR